MVTGYREWDSVVVKGRSVEPRVISHNSPLGDRRCRRNDTL